MNKNERMEALNKAGINTSKYFSVDLDNGTKIHLIIDENGDPKIVDAPVNNDPIYNQIIEDGYVRNTKLHRRFIMAQMFAALNYSSYNGEYSGYTDCINRSYDYVYTFKMMLEEVRVLSKLEVRDYDSFVERSHFFTKRVIAAVLEDYLLKLKKYINELPNHKCKGVPYKKIKGVNIFNDDLDKKVYAPVRAKISELRRARDYAEMYKVLTSFMRDMIKLPYNTPKSKDWIDAFKGEGAFYTLKNLVMFHNCGIENLHRMPMIYGTEAVKYITGKLDEYKGEYYRMFALMKKVIKDNNFDFKARMAQIYNK